MQCAISIVYDRNVGLLREVMVSPAPVLSVTLGKLLGGATNSVFQGSIPLVVAFATSLFTTVRAWFPSDPTALQDRTITALERVFPNLLSLDTVWTILLAWGAMFLMGIFMTALGVVIATRLKTFEGFGAISNGIIQPFYFLSGSIFPLRGVVGGVGFLQLPDSIRRELTRYGVYVTGAGWIVQLPWWIRDLVYANPVTYQLDLLRAILLDFHQLWLPTDLIVTFTLPVIGVVAASWSMARMFKNSEGRPMKRRRPGGGAATNGAGG
jgi:ABC-2 type transport system permease protein